MLRRLPHRETWKHRRAGRPRLLEPLETRALLSATPQMLKDINTQPVIDSPFNPSIEVNGILYGTGSDDSNGWELWKSDGTAEGTVLVKDVVPGTASSTPQYLTNVN